MAKEKKNLLTLAFYNREQIYRLLSLATEFKSKQRNKIPHRILEGKAIALIFNKPSTRTRISFETAIYHLGAYPLYLAGSDLQLGRGETLEDTGRILSRYVDAIVIRTYAHSEVVALAKAASIPVINALTDEHHPCQALADLLTILEKKNHFTGIKLAYIGDGNNVCHSLMIASAKVGINFVAACPPGYQPQERVVAIARDSLKDSGIEVIDNPREAAKNADVIYTDVWASMGQKDSPARRRAFAGFQVNKELLAIANPSAVVMHCLPAHRGQEITAEVLDGPQSIVFDQAENRIHISKALLAMLLKEGGI